MLHAKLHNKFLIFLLTFSLGLSAQDQNESDRVDLENSSLSDSSLQDSDSVKRSCNKCKEFCCLCVTDCLNAGRLNVRGRSSFGGNINASSLFLSGGGTITGNLTVLGTVTASGPLVTPGGAPIPPAGGLSSMFYGLTGTTGAPTPTDYAATVAVKTAAGTGRVPFPQTYSLGTSVTRNDANSFFLVNIGTYLVTVRVHTTEPGQLQLELNGTAQDHTTAANMNPTAGGHPIVINSIITTTTASSVLAVINPTGNSPALTITPGDGASTHRNAQTIVIQQLS